MRALAFKHAANLRVWLTARLGDSTRMRRAGTAGAILLVANEIRGVVVVLAVGLEPLRTLIEAM